MNPKEIAVAVTVEITGKEPDSTIPSGRGGPIMNRVTGTQNYSNYAQKPLGVSNSEILRWFKTAPDTIMATVRFIEATVGRWNEVTTDAKPLNQWTANEVYEYALEPVNRWIKGIIGEVFAENVVINGKVVEPKENDEPRGIDLRTTNKTYSIKTTEVFGEEKVEKTNADELIVVKVDSDHNVIDFKTEKL